VHKICVWHVCFAAPIVAKVIENGRCEAKIVSSWNNGCHVSQENVIKLWVALYRTFTDSYSILWIPEQGPIFVKIPDLIGRNVIQVITGKYVSEKRETTIIVLENKRNQGSIILPGQTPFFPLSKAVLSPIPVVPNFSGFVAPFQRLSTLVAPTHQ